MKNLNTAKCVGSSSNTIFTPNNSVKDTFRFCLFFVSFFLLPHLLTAQCATCTGNLVINGGFNTNTSSWNSTNGNFTADDPYPQCNTAKHAMIQRNSGVATFYQDVSGVAVGTQLSLTFWAGVHVNNNQKFGVEFYNGNSYLSESKLDINKILGGSPSMQFYTIPFTVPPSTTKIRVIGTADNDWIKVDEVCLVTICTNVPTITGSNALCSDNKSPTALTASGGGTYLWNTGATTATINVTPTTTTTYTVTVTNGGCVNSVSKTISVINCTGQICFNGANGVSATANWTITYTQDPINDKVKIRATLSKNFVDNTYGTNAIGWGSKGHTFGNLTGSDHLILSLLDGNNVKKMETKLDYISASGGGYDALGVTGGEGQMILGSSSDVLSATTSLDQNFNTYGYVLITNSPATDANYIPNPTYPNWIYDVWYEVEVRLSAFGSAGFGKVGITGVHASPSKTGNNTELVSEGPCCELSPTITGDTLVCAGKSTQLAATYLSNTTLEIYPSDDTYLSQKNSSDNFGTCKEFIIGSKSSSERSRALLKFNLSSLPAGANITSAKLIMTKKGGSNTSANFGVHRITQSWTEGTGACGGSSAASNWNQRQSGTSWSAAGGDFNATAESSISVGNDAEYTWDLKNLVIGWKNGSITNNGLLVKMLSEGSDIEKKFASFDEGDATKRPVLAITYLVPPAPGTSQYLWSTGATTSSITVNPLNATTYTVTVSETGGCTGIKEIDLSVHPKPTVDAGANSTICTGQSIILSASATGGSTPYTYAWSDGLANGASRTPTATKTYTVTVTDNKGCTATDDVVVSIGSNINLVASNITICKGSSGQITATASGGALPYIYTWSDNLGTGATKTVSPIATKTYTVTVEDGNGCTKTATATVTVKPAPTVDIGPDITICTLDEEVIQSTVTNITQCGMNGESDCDHVLQGTTGWIESASTAAKCGDNAGAKLWTRSGDGTSSLTLDFGKNVPSGTTICVRMKLEHCSNTSSSNSDARIQRSPEQPISYNDVIASKTFTNTNYVEYCYTLSAATRYIKVVDNGKCAFRVDYVKYTIPDTYNNSIQYAWSGPGIVGSNTGPSVVVNQSGTYTLVVTDCGGCTASDQMVVINNGNVDANAGADKILCKGGSVLLSATPVVGATYEWRSEVNNQVISTNQSVTVSPIVTTSYILKVTRNGCEDTDDVIVTVNDPPVASAGADVTINCTTTSATLTATGGGTYKWNTNATTAAITVSPATTSTYTVTVTAANGCTATDEVVVTVNKTPPTANAGADVTVNCTTPSASLTASGGGTYKWNTNATTAAITVTPMVTTTYTVTVTAANGCTASDEVVVTANKTPPTANAGPDKIICTGQSANLIASGGGTYKWSTNATTASITVSPTVATTYTVTVTAANGCTASDEALVTINQSPFNSGISGPDQVCVNDYATFAANPPLQGATYLWMLDGGMTEDGDADDITEKIKWGEAFKNTFRTVKLTITKDGCSTDFTKTIYIKQGVFLNTPGSFEVCQGGAVTIGPNPNDPAQVSPGATFTWTPNLFLNSNTVAQPLANPPFDITYTLTATINGCVETRQVFVDVDINLNPIADAGPDKTICIGESVQIGGNPTATPPTKPVGATIQGLVWTPGGSLLPNPMVSPITNTTYRVVVVASTGCADTDYVDIKVEPKAKVGDFVWEDTNGNGLQDNGEPGINGVAVTLYNSATNAIVETTNTITKDEKLGYYQFEVCKGSYYIIFGNVPTYNRTAKDKGDDTKDSDANSNTGRTDNFVLNPGDNNQTIDAGYYKPASIGDFVWEDLNANGVQDVGEPGIPGVSVTLTGTDGNGTPVNLNTNTNGLGLYLFSNLVPGTYKVTFGSPGVGYILTGQDRGVDDTKDSDAALGTLMTINTVLISGETDLTWDAGFYRLASIGDFVWLDTNENGIQDPGELGIPNVTVSITGILADNSIVPPAAQLTGPQGQYLFSGLTPGRYTVVVNKPADFKFSPKDQGGDETKDSDSDPVTGIMPEETLTSGENNLTYDAGLYPDIKLELEKTFISAVPLANGSFDITYDIKVKNLGGSGNYTLTDNQGFDLDAIINSASFTSNAPGNPGLNLAGIATWTLATNQVIAAFATHTYTLKVNVKLNFTDNIGDNVYQPCLTQTPTVGRGLYNKARVFVSNVLKDEDDACGDIPNITLVKDFVSVTPKANGSFDVVYKITVGNNGGAPGTYSLKDTPQFDDDVVINSGSYTGHSSGPMNTVGSTTMATNLSLAAGSNHMYNVTFNVSLDVNPNSNQGGDNVYRPCEVPGNGPGSTLGHGLYNKAEVDRTGDGITDLTDDACGDIPNITLVKDFVSVTPRANGTFDVRYKITVGNNGGAIGTYNLKDSPLFDDDVTILAWDYTFLDVLGGIGNGPAFIGAPLIPIDLGTKQITPGNSHIYTLTFNVSLDVNPNSNQGGDNVYRPCEVPGNGPGSTLGHGLYNKAEVDRTGDGITDLTDDACGDIPNITLIKDFVSVTPKANGSFDVVYKITVANNGGATGTYSLKDTPQFDDDVVINSGSFSGQASGPMNTSGSTTLATNVSLGAGLNHMYFVTFNVSLDLNPNSTQGGDNVYRPCEVPGNGPGSSAGHGLYNKAEVDKTGDGITDLTDDACGDIPNITLVKDFVSVTPKANGSFDVLYKITVGNNGGATGTYTLKDTPQFDDDVVINSGSFNGQASGPMNTSGSTTLANNVSLGAGLNHMYFVTFNVSLDLNPNSNQGGDNVYRPCEVPGNGPGSTSGHGLYNKAEVDKTGDGITDLTDDACGDIPNITLVKDFVSVVNVEGGYYDVNYKITVGNTGGATGFYSLTDQPLFDDDIEIVSGAFSGQANGFMNLVGSTTLANNVPIIPGGIHMYNVTFRVFLNLQVNSGGDNIYMPCEVPGNGPGSTSGHGLYNIARLDKTGDNIPDLTDDACGDLPKGSIGDFVWEDKNANGVQDIGEPGIPNVLVRLFNSVGAQISSILTGPQGQYLFPNLNPGIYSVGFPIVGGYIRTEPDKGIDDAKDSDASKVTGFTPQIILGPGENNLTIDAGYYKLAKIGDFVWEDTNLNGVQDPLEPGLSGVTVKLTGTDGNGTPVNLMTTTSGVGFYEFANLVPGNYMVEFVRPAPNGNGQKYVSSPRDAGGDDTKDSDADIVTGKTVVYTLNSGDNNMTVDAGFYRCAEVGDYVWYDGLSSVSNNVQDAGDVGLNNVTVELYNQSNPVVVFMTQQTRNGPDGKPGYYLFECVPPGIYKIRVKTPNPTYEFVTPNFGLDDNIDSDVTDFPNESTLNFTVTYAQIIHDIDIGFKSKPLPVDLSRFDGRWNQIKDVNELDWATLSEQNSDFFEVQRSFKGSRYFAIGQVKSAGNSNTLKVYNFVDDDISSNGIYSYRLRQVDIDGKETFTKVVNIIVDRVSDRSVVMYPNPATQMVTVELSANEGSKVAASIFDNTGKLVMGGIFDEVLQKSKNAYNIDINILKPGVYTLMVILDGDISTHKLIVIK
jgi:hypothetical protein